MGRVIPLLKSGKDVQTDFPSIANSEDTANTLTRELYAWMQVVCGIQRVKVQTHYTKTGCSPR